LRYINFTVFKVQTRSYSLPIILFSLAVILSYIATAVEVIVGQGTPNFHGSPRPFLLFTVTIFFVFYVLGSVHRKHILTYIQQDSILHSLFYLETALHVSGGTTTHHQERKQLYLQHLVFVTTLLLPAAIVEEMERSSNSSTSWNGVCAYILIGIKHKI